MKYKILVIQHLYSKTGKKNPIIHLSILSAGSITAFLWEKKAEIP